MSDELAYSELTSMVSLAGTTYQQVTALTATFTAPDGPVMVKVMGKFATSTAGHSVVLQVRLGLVPIGHIEDRMAGADVWQTASRESRVGGLVPGALYTVTAWIKCLGGSTARIGGDPQSPVFVQVLAL